MHGAFDAEALERLRTQIDDEERRARQRLTALSRDFDAIVEATAEANTDDEHDPEGATIGFERAQVAALRETARARLTELAEARKRLESGELGRCERCAGRIPLERVLARPTTRRCIDCAG